MAFIAIIRNLHSGYKPECGGCGTHPLSSRRCVGYSHLPESLTYVNSSGLAICHLPPFYILLSYAIFTAFLHIEVYWAYWPQTRLFLAVIQ
ncbi:hypothetical protein EGX47_10700 [Yersinia pseudotuberculosis]|uniref:Uncharacterized protein n=1 Tax=Yersinia pseudotuberculosis TaxID=633 RepID=A0ABN5R408_YERPU|nr:hypothetical protein EGX47_10700 [Yersinia pseudotuberculosis]AYW96035.1 hypothetical protein EGX39_09510 [Yersinia pseudotuberculosis]MBO1554345.1 hypothetical protein [Yersinia pseudotuberculosis]MBO1560017.1 hypothetical protein [Yersinia pseudotuberculosis]